jgi:hypothetical protein
MSSRNKRFGAIAAPFKEKLAKNGCRVDFTILNASSSRLQKGLLFIP